MGRLGIKVVTNSLLKSMYLVEKSNREKYPQNPKNVRLRGKVKCIPMFR